MKQRVLILACALLVCLAALGHAAPPPGVKGSYEISEATVSHVLSANEGEFRFIAYLVKWKDSDVVVSDTLAKSNYQVGDKIRFMVHKTSIENQEPKIFTLNFSLMMLPAKPAAAG